MVGYPNEIPRGVFSRQDSIGGVIQTSKQRWTAILRAFKYKAHRDSLLCSALRVSLELASEIVNYS